MKIDKEQLITLLQNELNPKTLTLSSNQKLINSFSPNKLAEEYSLIQQGKSTLSSNQRQIVLWKVNRFLEKYVKIE